jgi:hypothetical protein
MLLIIEEIESDPAELTFVLTLLFETYSRYVDRPSRRAVGSCLGAIIADDQGVEAVGVFIKLLEQDAAKLTIASSSAFVLVEWCSILLEQLGKTSAAWDRYGVTVACANALVLETCLSSASRNSVKQSASRVSKKAIRVLLRSCHNPANIIKSIVTQLVSKGTSYKARNAPFLGVLSDVCGEFPELKEPFSEIKSEYFSFIVKEIIGSRTILPVHITSSFRVFFEHFATLKDIVSELIPPAEKALLRSPEIVLTGLLSRLAESFPGRWDLSEILFKNLLKPLLANTKSSNVAIRIGALDTFEQFANKSKEEAFTEPLAEEILNNLKAKTATAEQRTVLAQMLTAVHSSSASSQKLPLALAAIALKESNDTAMNAEVLALAKHVKQSLILDRNVDKSTVEAFVKGLADKKPSTRRSWGIRFAEIVWDLSETQLSHRSAVILVTSVLEAFQGSWKEILSNPISAAQNGLLPLGYILIALLMDKRFETCMEKLDQLKKSTSLLPNALAAQSKPSFLLNHRVYTKLTSDDDFIWAVRALASLSDEVVRSQDKNIQDAWSQAYIYCITATGIPHSARRHATKSLSKTYFQNPVSVGQIIREGLWSWYRRIEMAEKDTAAVSAKTGTSELFHVLRSICMSVDTLQRHGVDNGKGILEAQLIDLIIIARPMIVPKARWIDVCLEVGVDPGQLVRNNCEECLRRIIEITQVNTSILSLKFLHTHVFRKGKNVAELSR